MMATRTRHWFTGELRTIPYAHGWSCGHRHATREKAQACAEKRWNGIVATSKAEIFVATHWSIPVDEVFSGYNWRAEP